MARKRLKAALLLIVVVVLLCAAGAGAAFLFLDHRADTLLEDADKTFEEGNWQWAKNNYAWYLMKRENDPYALERYAEASARILADRETQLQDASRGYFQLVRAQPDNREALSTLLEFCVQHRQWQNLNYYADFLLNNSPDNEALQYHRALALHRMGNAAAAIDSYRDILASGTDNAAVYGNLAQLLAEQGFPEQAEELLDQGLVDHPEQPRIYYERARFYEARGDLAAAQAEIDAAMAREDADPDTLALAADIALAAGNTPRAVEMAEAALAQDARQTKAYFVLVSARREQGKNEDAIAALEQVDPYLTVDNPELLLTLAELNLLEENIQKAHEAIEQYKIAYPLNLAIPEYFAARELLLADRPAEAAGKFAAVFRRMPELHEATFYEAYAHLVAGDMERARVALESYLRNRPDDQRAQMMWRLAFRGPESAEEARGAAQALLASSEADSGNLLAAAISLMNAANAPDASATDRQLARELLEEAVQQAPGQPEGHQLLISALLAEGDVAAARAALSSAEAAGLNPSDLDLLRGRIAVAAGEPAQALEQFVARLEQSGASENEAREWADVFAGAGHLDLALDALTRAAEAAPAAESHAYELGKAAVLRRAGRLQEALAILQDMQEQAGEDPSRREALVGEQLALAEALLATGAPANQETALQLAEDVSLGEAEAPRARILQARMLLQQNPPDFQQAQSLAEAALAENPEDVSALLLLADIRLTQGQYAAAVEAAKDAVELSPMHTTAKLALAEAHLSAGHLPEARERLDEVLGIAPDHPRALDQLVRLHLAEAQYLQAENRLQQLEKAAAANEDFAERAAYLRGLLLTAQQRWNDAESLLREQYAQHRDDLDLARSLAIVLARQGRLQEALDLLREFGAREGTGPEYWATLGELQRQSGGEEGLRQAYSSFQQALLATQDYLPALRGMIAVQAELNNTEAAYALCNRYLEQNPEDADILYQKAVLLATQPAREQEALAALEKAARLEQRPDLKFLRGQLFLNLEDYEKALADLQSFAQMGGRTSAELDAMLSAAYLGLEDFSLAERYYESMQRKMSAGETVNAVRLEKLAQAFEGEEQQGG